MHHPKELSMLCSVALCYHVPKLEHLPAITHVIKHTDTNVYYCSGVQMWVPSHKWHFWVTASSVTVMNLPLFFVNSRRKNWKKHQQINNNTFIYSLITAFMELKTAFPRAIALKMAFFCRRKHYTFTGVTR